MIYGPKKMRYILIECKNLFEIFSVTVAAQNMNLKRMFLNT